MISKQLRYNKFPLFQATFFLICLLCSAGSHAEIKLSFGIYTADKPTTMVTAYRPVLSALEEVLSEKLQEPVSIRFHVASSYKKGIDALVTGKVDFSMLGPASYIEALNRQPELEILALESKDGSKTFNGVVCVHEDSDIKTISDLKGKRFAFGNKRSTIGRYLSQSLLAQNGITALNLRSFNYLGRHDHVAHSVAWGRYDAGALKEGTYKKLKKNGLQLRVLTTIPLINRPWVASASLDKTVFAALKESMLSLDAPQAFSAMGRSQFVDGNDTDFADVRAAMKGNAAFFEPKWQPVAITDQ